MISYANSVSDITEKNLIGFFESWPNPPSAKTHLKLLKNSDKVVVAVDNGSDKIVGFVTAVSDDVLSACIPFLEVLPEHRGQGIGRELMRRILDQLSGLYMVNLSCDEKLQSFHERFGMRRAHGMMLRNYERQSGS